MVLTITRANLQIALDKVKFGKNKISYEFEGERVITEFNGKTRTLAFETNDGKFRPTLYGLRVITGNTQRGKSDKAGSGKVHNSEDKGGEPPLRN